MRALADDWNRSRNPAPVPARSAPRLAVAEDEAFAEPPPETDAWWLSRSADPTFSRRRVPLPDACARALAAAPEIVVEFNGATFTGAALATNDGGCELDLGDALAQEMAEVLDEDDVLEVEMLAGRARPTVAIHPHVGAAR